MIPLANIFALSRNILIILNTFTRGTEGNVRESF